MSEGAGGLPWVALHKLGGWKAEWYRLAPRLGRGCIALDLPGHGLTEHDEPPHIQSVAKSAEHVMAGLDGVGVGRFDLVGASLGGAVAVHIASRWPDRVGRLVLISTPLTAASTHAELSEADAQSDRLYLPDDRPRPRTGEQIETLFGVTSKSVQADLEAARMAAGRWIRPSWRGVSLADVAGCLPHITAPTLLLYGERGGYRQFEAVGRAGLPQVSVAVVPDSGAFPHQENPLETARIMRG
jgi:pimeloyl-ACP methyl ester carboxylesterase